MPHPFDPNLTLVVWLRHARHENQIVPESAYAELAYEGMMLERLGIKIDVVFGSPLPRAVRSALMLTAGNNSVAKIYTHNALGDFTTNPGLGPLVPMIKAAAAAEGAEAEAFALQMNNVNVRERILEIGRLAAKQVEIAKATLAGPGGVLLVPGHSPALELAIMSMRGRKFLGEDTDSNIPITPPFMMERGSVAVTIFSYGSYVDTQYLGIVDDNTTWPPAP